ncbi:hypothetical protein ACFY05_33000 [Microtetraspora fusca]|uniref:Uncharacterized protein n=1 Tax=Microtetraspora fusca TaxID=1997 RepID=A0ABW6VEC0_MICFU
MLSDLDRPCTIRRFTVWHNPSGRYVPGYTRLTLVFEGEAELPARDPQGHAFLYRLLENPDRREFRAPTGGYDTSAGWDHDHPARAIGLDYRARGLRAPRVGDVIVLGRTAMAIPPHAWWEIVPDPSISDPSRERKS